MASYSPIKRSVLSSSNRIKNHQLAQDRDCVKGHTDVPQVAMSGRTDNAEHSVCFANNHKSLLARTPVALA